MKDIATSLGIHPSTVSLALRQDPRITPETRQRVEDEAKRLGYQANPLVSSLMTYRSRRQPPPYRMELAFVCATETRQEWLKMSEAYRRMWKGAQARAQELGYALNLYPRKPGELSAARFSEILNARNIHGILIAPMPFSDVRMDVQWERFSVIELGYTLIEPDFHKVVHDYFHSMRLLLKEIRARGYERVGLFLQENVDEKVHHLWRAAYVDEQECLPRRLRIKPLIRLKISPADLKNWMDKHAPEALITADIQLARRLLDSSGVPATNSPKLFSLGCYRQDDDVPGIYQDYGSMGATAVEQLIGMVLRAEHGIPSRSVHTQVTGLWVAGTRDHPETSHRSPM